MVPPPPLIKDINQKPKTDFIETPHYLTTFSFLPLSTHSITSPGLHPLQLKWRCATYHFQAE